jgi:hypothetical protein
MAHDDGEAGERHGRQDVGADSRVLLDLLVFLR